MKELREVYNKLKNSSQQEKNIASSQAGIVEHLNNIAEARNKANEGQEKNAIAMLKQRNIKCNCNGKCVNNRCGCFLGKIGCNTKCHAKSTKC
jgi:hypothetical protein